MEELFTILVVMWPRFRMKPHIIDAKAVDGRMLTHSILFFCYPHFLPTKVRHYNESGKKACDVMRNVAISFETPSEKHNFQILHATL